MHYALKPRKFSGILHPHVRIAEMHDAKYSVMTQYFPSFRRMN